MGDLTFLSLSDAIVLECTNKPLASSNLKAEKAIGQHGKPRADSSALPPPMYLMFSLTEFDNVFIYDLMAHCHKHIRTRLCWDVVFGETRILGYDHSNLASEQTISFFEARVASSTIYRHTVHIQTHWHTWTYVTHTHKQPFHAGSRYLGGHYVVLRNTLSVQVPCAL